MALVGQLAASAGIMAVMLYLLAHLVRPLNSDYDLIVVCVLVALEGPGYLRAYLLWRRQ